MKREQRSRPWLVNSCLSSAPASLPLRTKEAQTIAEVPSKLVSEVCCLNQNHRKSFALKPCLKQMAKVATASIVDRRRDTAKRPFSLIPKFLRTGDQKVFDRKKVELRLPTVVRFTEPLVNGVKRTQKWDCSAPTCDAHEECREDVAFTCWRSIEDDHPDQLRVPFFDWFWSQLKKGHIYCGPDLPTENRHGVVKYLRAVFTP